MTRGAHALGGCFALALLASTAACVTTQASDGHGPDPRTVSENAPPAADGASGTGGEPSAPQTVALLDPADPIVNIRVVFRVGSADDPAGKEGAAVVTARLMRQATRALSAAQLADTLFPMAAELGVQVDKDTIGFLGRTHRDHADRFLALLVDVLTAPRLDAADFARIKQEQLDELQNGLRGNADEQLQREALETLLYDGDRLIPHAFAARAARHAYAHTPDGTVAGLRALTLEDVRAFQARLGRNNLVLGVSGGLSEEKLAELRTALLVLPDAPARAPVAAPPVQEHSAALIIEKPAAATAISVGFALPTLNRSHPDYVAMKLAETWFGEHRSLIGHLFHTMREVRGLNYGNYAYVEHFVQEGSSTYEQLNIPRRTQYFSMWIRPVEHKNAAFALRQTVSELASFVTAGIPDDASFARVQAFVQGYWPGKSQEPMRRLGYAVDEVLTAMPFTRDELVRRSATLTRAEVNAAIARHLHHEKLAIVVVTDAAARVAPALSGAEATPMAYASPPDAATAAQDRLIERFDLGVAPADVRVVQSSALFAE